MKVVMLIPAYNPDEKLITYVKDLKKLGFEKIIVVNDGSEKSCDKIFKEIKKDCIILNHQVNQGKGRAIKTAINYYLENLKDYKGLVTADCDGQHTPKDTLKIAKSLEKHPNSLILGTRDFDEKDVPTRSKLGNKITTTIFKLLYGKKINDTQTGLRGIPNNFMEMSMKLNGEKYDYEINVLIYAVRNNIEIIEEKIHTIYLDGNIMSHFNPLRDSYRIYKILFTEFFKYTYSGIISFIIDILLFSVFSFVFDKIILAYSILISTILARIISSLFNYYMNKNLVFNNKEKSGRTLVKYYVLCVIQMLISGLAVSLIVNKLKVGKVIIKVIVDAILFFVSYKIQQQFVFKLKENSKC